MEQYIKKELGIRMERFLLRIFGVFGIVFFAPLFLLTFSDPQLIEMSGKSFIEWKLKSETDNKIDSFQLPKQTAVEKLFGEKAAELRNKTEQKLEDLKKQLKADAPAILAEQIAKLRNLDCECRQKWEQRIRNSMLNQVTSLEQAKSKLIEFSQAKYMEIVEKLTMDVRIFLGANAVVFLFLFLVSFLKPNAVKHLFLPGGLLLVSSLICSFFYLFEQNWFYTIIYNDYTGYSYIGYLLLVFGVLCDIAFNKARVTTEIINACLEAIGHVGSLAPC